MRGSNLSSRLPKLSVDDGRLVCVLKVCMMKEVLDVNSSQQAASWCDLTPHLESIDNYVTHMADKARRTAGLPIEDPLTNYNTPQANTHVVFLCSSQDTHTHTRIHLTAYCPRQRIIHRPDSVSASSSLLKYTTSHPGQQMDTTQQ